MTSTKSPEQSVPPAIAGAPLVRTAQHAEIVRRLAGAVTTPRWLPAGAWAEVDELREQHFRHLRAIAAVQGEEDELRAGWGEADQGYQEALDEAARTFSKPKAKAPPTEQERQEALAPIEARTWAALAALVDWADGALEALRQGEDDLAAGLVGELAPLDAEAAEIQRRLGEIATARDRLARRALWLRRTTDGELRGGSRFEPGEVDVPAGTPPLPVTAESLKRSWSELRPWNAGFERLEDYVSRSYPTMSEETHAEATIAAHERSITNA